MIKFKEWMALKEDVNAINNQVKTSPEAIAAAEKFLKKRNGIAGENPEATIQAAVADKDMQRLKPRDASAAMDYIKGQAGSVKK